MRRSVAALSRKPDAFGSVRSRAQFPARLSRNRIAEKHPTPNIQHPTPNGPLPRTLFDVRRWMLDVGCWMFCLRKTFAKMADIPLRGMEACHTTPRASSPPGRGQGWVRQRNGQIDRVSVRGFSWFSSTGCILVKDLVDRVVEREQDVLSECQPRQCFRFLRHQVEILP